MNCSRGRTSAIIFFDQFTFFSTFESLYFCFKCVGEYMKYMLFKFRIIILCEKLFKTIGWSTQQFLKMKCEFFAFFILFKTWGTTYDIFIYFSFLPLFFLHYIPPTFFHYIPPILLYYYSIFFSFLRRKENI